jgi:hypothetical protein
VQKRNGAVEHSPLGASPGRRRPMRTIGVA